MTSDYIVAGPNSIHKPPPIYRDEKLKGSTVTARACLMDANSIDASGSWIEIK